MSAALSPLAASELTPLLRDWSSSCSLLILSSHLEALSSALSLLWSASTSFLHVSPRVSWRYESPDSPHHLLRPPVGLLSNLLGLRHLPLQHLNLVRGHLVFLLHGLTASIRRLEGGVGVFNLDICRLQPVLQLVPPVLQQPDLPLQRQNLGLALISRPLLSLVLLTGLLGLVLIVMQPLVILLSSQCECQ